MSAVVLLAYGFDVGAGFIKEDATWIMRSRVDAVPDLVRLGTETGGFFRPVVGLSFAVNHWVAGGRPAGYGWINLLLALAAAAAAYRFGRAVGLGRGAALFMAALWILNFHGIGMAVLWLSGRTALLLVLFSLLSASAAARDRITATTFFALLAMGSKEEGVLLPLILMGVWWLRPSGPRSRGRTIAFAGALAVAWCAYGIARSFSDAYTPDAAPAFYTFTAAPAVVGDNLAEYADRALTLPAAATLLALAIGRSVVRPPPQCIRLLLLSACWLGAGFGLTIFLPARSSLYVLLPSVGAVLAAAAMVDAAWASFTLPRQRALAALAALLPLAFVPVYWQRNQRWTELGETSARTVAAFAELAPAASQPWTAIVLDDPAIRANVASALGWGLPDTVELVTGKRPHVWIAPPPLDIDEREIVTLPPTADAILGFREGDVVRLPDRPVTPLKGAEFR